MEQPDSCDDCALVCFGISDKERKKIQLFGFGYPGGFHDGGQRDVYFNGAGGLRSECRFGISRRSGSCRRGFCVLLLLQNKISKII